MKKLKKIFCCGLIFALICGAAGCVNQHPEEASGSSENSAGKAKSGSSPKLVATSTAIADITDRLELDLIGVCQTSGDLPERYADVTQVGMPMSPDLEILKSLDPDYVLSPNTLESDLQPKYESIGVSSLFLNLKSVDGMYASIEDLGEKFGREEQAGELVEEYETFMEEYDAQNARNEKPSVLILMGLPGSYIVATENSYVGNLVKMAGGVNVYQGEEDEFISANTEDMQTKDPDIILRAVHGLEEEAREMFAEEFETNDIWQHFRAVEEGKVYDLDGELFGMSADFDYPKALDELQTLFYGEGE